MVDLRPQIGIPAGASAIDEPKMKGSTFRLTLLKFYRLISTRWQQSKKSSSSDTTPGHKRLQDVDALVDIQLPDVVSESPHKVYLLLFFHILLNKINVWKPLIWMMLKLFMHAWHEKERKDYSGIQGWQRGGWGPNTLFTLFIPLGISIFNPNLSSL